MPLKQDYRNNKNYNHKKESPFSTFWFCDCLYSWYASEFPKISALYFLLSLLLWSNITYSTDTTIRMYLWLIDEEEACVPTLPCTWSVGTPGQWCGSQGHRSQGGTAAETIIPTLTILTLRFHTHGNDIQNGKHLSTNVTPRNFLSDSFADTIQVTTWSDYFLHPHEKLHHLHT